jgi:hypothetical protein
MSDSGAYRTVEPTVTVLAVVKIRMVAATKSYPLWTDGGNSCGVKPSALGLDRNAVEQRSRLVPCLVMPPCLKRFHSTVW